MSPVLAEFIGTTLLVLFGNGVVANVVLSGTKGHNAGWIVITAGWGLGVFIGVFCAQPFSGAHLNPAVTLAMASAGKLAWTQVGGYVLAQMLGGVFGGLLVFLFYREHFKASFVAGAGQEGQRLGIRVGAGGGTPLGRSARGAPAFVPQVRTL